MIAWRLKKETQITDNQFMHERSTMKNNLLTMICDEAILDR